MPLEVDREETEEKEKIGERKKCLRGWQYAREQRWPVGAVDTEQNQRTQGSSMGATCQQEKATET